MEFGFEGLTPLPPGGVTSYQHRGSNVELLLVLRDEDVRFDEVLGVFLLDFAQYVRHPLELTLRSRHPHEVHLPETTPRTPRQFSYDKTAQQ